MNFLKLLYKQYPLLSLIIFSGIIYISHLEVLPVTIMEARNFITAREMLNQNNWIFTTLNDMPRYEKPPLPTWLTAISASIFGIKSVFGLRLPAAISAIILVIFSYKSAMQIGASKAVSFFTGLVVASSFYVVVSGRSGQWDIFTHSFMMIAIYCLLKVFNEQTRQTWLWTILGGISFGFSILSKGPVSLYALFLPFIISYLIVFKFDGLRKNIFPVLVFILTGIAVGTWWIAVVHYFDAETFTSVAAEESYRWLSYNVRPIYYYWSFFVQSGIWTIPCLLGLGYWYLKIRVSNIQVYKFYFFWTIGSLILLSIIPEKKSRYLFPVLIPLAATTAYYLEFLLLHFSAQWRKTEKLPILIYFGLLTFICLAAPAVVYIAIKTSIMYHIFWYISFSILIFGLGIISVFSLKNLRIKELIALPFLMTIIIIFFGFPLIKSKEQNAENTDVANLKNYSKSHDLKIYDATGVMPELLFEYGREIPLILNPQDLEKVPEKRFGLLVHEGDTPDYKSIFKDYNLKLIDSVDVNPNLFQSSNDRLKRKLFLVTAK